MKDPAAMTAAEVNRELDKLSQESTRITDELIAAGRSDERPSETRKKDDPIARRFKANVDRMNELHREVEARMGPGYRRLSPGFKRRKTFKGVNFKRTRLINPKACAKGSFRTKKVGKSGAFLTVCCPRGQWQPRKQRCKVGVKAQAISRPRR